MQDNPLTLFLSPKGRGKEKEKDFLDDYIVFNELNNYIFLSVFREARIPIP